MQPMPSPPGQEPWAGSPIVPMYQPPKFVSIVAMMHGIAILVDYASFHAAVLLPPPGQFQSPNPDVVAYQLTVRALVATFLAAMDAVVAGSVAFGWAWGLGKPEITEAARRGILLFSIVLLAFWILFTMFTTSFFFGFVP